MILVYFIFMLFNHSMSFYIIFLILYDYIFFYFMFLFILHNNNIVCHFINYTVLYHFVSKLHVFV